MSGSSLVVMIVPEISIDSCLISVTLETLLFLDDLVSLLEGVSLEFEASWLVSTGDVGDNGLILLEFESVRVRFLPLTPSLLSTDMLDRRRVEDRPRVRRGFSTTDERGASSLNELERELERDDSLDSLSDLSKATTDDNLGEKSGVTGGVAQCKAIKC